MNQTEKQKLLQITCGIAPRIPYTTRIHCCEWVPIDDAKPYSGNGTDTLEFDQIKARKARLEFERELQSRRLELRCAAIKLAMIGQ